MHIFWICNPNFLLAYSCAIHDKKYEYELVYRWKRKLDCNMTNKHYVHFSINPPSNSLIFCFSFISSIVSSLIHIAALYLLSSWLYHKFPWLLLIWKGRTFLSFNRFFFCPFPRSLLLDIYPICKICSSHFLPHPSSVLKPSI